ncbi:hypothetical protein PO909_027657 [Leuciscus waleckii]
MAEEEEEPVVRQSATPIFMGAPWAQKYGGPGSEEPLRKKKQQSQRTERSGTSEVTPAQFPCASLSLSVHDPFHLHDPFYVCV